MSSTAPVFIRINIQCTYQPYPPEHHHVNAHKSRTPKTVNTCFAQRSHSIKEETTCVAFPFDDEWNAEVEVTLGKPRTNQLEDPRLMGHSHSQCRNRELPMPTEAKKFVFRGATAGRSIPKHLTAAARKDPEGSSTASRDVQQNSPEANPARRPIGRDIQHHCVRRRLRAGTTCPRLAYGPYRIDASNVNPPGCGVRHPIRETFRGNLCKATLQRAPSLQTSGLNGGVAT